MQQKPLRFTRTRVFDIPIHDLWPLLSDTDRINRAATIPATSFTPAVREDGLPYMVARARYLGVPVRWDVLPFEWSVERWFRVEYRFVRTPFVRALQVGVEFTPLSASQTRAEIFVDSWVKPPLGALVARLLVGKHLLDQYARVYEQIERNYHARTATIIPKPQRSRVDEQALAVAAERLRQAPVSPALVERLVARLREGVDQEVMGMRPFVLADGWGVDRLETLRLCLYATRVGLLDLSWEILCPNCRVSKGSFGSLAALREQAHCGTCNIEYDLNFDEYVEVRFNVNANIRQAYLLSYCIAEPARLVHVLGQVRVAPGTTQELPLSLAEGRYKLRVVRWPEPVTLQASAEAGQARARITLAGERITAESGTLQAGECVLELDNQSSHETLVIVERSAWDAQGASAALVTSLQEFRQLFSSEVLAPGLGVSVRNLAILFTDLKGSTRLYADIGDPSAFALVRDHFEVLTQVLQRRRGALVKTIGDAVMAVFLIAQDALEAALEMLAEIELLNQRYPDQPSLHLKLGIHQGPCIAVNANDILDYFGSTVNLAARAQGESRGDDFVLTQALMDEPAVRARLERAGLQPEVFTVTPKGFSEPVTLYRFVVPQRQARTLASAG